MRGFRRFMARRRATPAIDWDGLAGHQVVSICHPAWRGIRTAALTFGAPIVDLEDAGSEATEIVTRLQEAGVDTIIVQGFPPGSATLLQEASRAGLETRCLLHSSMTQHGAEAHEAAVADEVFDLGPRLLEAVAALPPDAVTVRVHADRSGQPAFRSISFARPHELVYRGAVEVRLR